MDSWTRFWAGFALTLAGIVSWALSYAGPAAHSLALSLASIALEVLGLYLLVPLLLERLRSEGPTNPSTESSGAKSAIVVQATVASRAELDRLWWRGPGIAGVMLATAGPLLAGLDCWFIIFELYIRPRHPLSTEVMVTLAIFLLGLSGFALSTGLYYLVHRPTRFEVDDNGIRVEHTSNPPFAVSWNDRPLRLRVLDMRPVRPGLTGTPPFIVTFGRRLSYAVPAAVGEAILNQLSSRGMGTRKSNGSSRGVPEETSVDLR